MSRERRRINADGYNDLDFHHMDRGRDGGLRLIGEDDQCIGSLYVPRGETITSSLRSHQLEFDPAANDD